MHDMFIQSQQLVTSSSGAVQPKKRRAEHYNIGNSTTNNGVNATTSTGNGTGEQFLHQEQQHHQLQQHQQQQPYAAVNTSSQTELNHASPGSQRTFVRASTIKLLDTYQRCGQKV